MPNIIVDKTDRHDTKDPRTFGVTDAAIAKGEQVMERAEWDSPAQKRDYMRMVSANEKNFPGLPPQLMFKEDKAKLALSDLRQSRQCQCGGCCTAVDGYICPRCHEQN